MGIIAELIKRPEMFLIVVGLLFIILGVLGTLRSKWVNIILKTYQRIFFILLGLSTMMFGIYFLSQFSQYKQFAIYGRVFERSGEKPIKDAEVKANEKNVLTDDDGYFYINYKQEDEGMYVRVKIIKEDFESQARYAYVKKKTEPLVFQLVRTKGEARIPRISPEPAPEVSLSFDSLYRGTLTLWVSSRMATNGDAKFAEKLIKEFKKDFPSLDLRYKEFFPDNFLDAIKDTKEKESFPDVAFIDNYSQLGPLVRDNAVQTMSGRSRFGYRGWWVIFKAGKYSDTAQTFIRWLSRSPRWKPMRVKTTSISMEHVQSVQTIAKNALIYLVQGDFPRFWSLTDSEGARFREWSSKSASTLIDVQPILTFGNSRLAFVLLASVGSSDKNYGMTHSVIVLRKRDNEWKVLLLLYNAPLPQLEEILISFDEVDLVEGPFKSLPTVTLLAPPNKARKPRFPQKPDIEWTTVNTDVVLYVLESQFGQSEIEEGWTTSWIETIMPPQKGKKSMQMIAPFGVGMQPHRWRIWAIDKFGNISISEWRTIYFTN